MQDALEKNNLESILELDREAFEYIRGCGQQQSYLLSLSERTVQEKYKMVLKAQHSNPFPPDFPRNLEQMYLRMRTNIACEPVPEP
jgi:hypothetical protein